MNLDKENFLVKPFPESRKIELFAGRRELIHLFATYLNDADCHETILYFYGDGGNGKSLLLKYLRQKCCKRFPSTLWNEKNAQPDPQTVIANYLQTTIDWEDNSKELPAILLDFGMQPRDQEQPQDAFYGPLMLRRNLAIAASKLGYPLQFPHYDFACLWYLHKTGKSREEIKKLFPPEELELISVIIDAISKNVWANLMRLVVQNLTKHLSEPLTLSWAKRNLDEQWLARLQAMAPDTEIIEQLPCWLAQDINAAMAQPGAPPRLVLFLDTHEAFWGHQRHLPEDIFFYQDEWLRQFLNTLNLKSGIVVAVAGREPPKWTQAPKAAISPETIALHQVEHLSAADALNYLNNVGISDLALAKALIDYASVRPGEVQPLYLGLCADLAIAALKRGDTLTPAEFAAHPETPNKSKELINRLLRYVNPEIREAVHSLSACRAFNLPLYLKLGQQLNFEATTPKFRLLTDFSFVWRSEERGQDWYRIHDLLRRLDIQGGNTTTLKAHQVLEQHYRDEGEIAEAIYHANYLNPERAVEEWVEQLETALRASRFEQCRQLLEIRNELFIKSEFLLGKVSEFLLGKVSAAEGHYLGRVARYSEAKQKYLEAIAALTRLLDLESHCIEAWNEKAIALARLGDLQARLSENAEALQTYQIAIVACERALELDSEDFSAHQYRGIALRRLGELQVKQSFYPEALVSYTCAIASYERATQLRPQEASLLNNQGNALNSLGELLLLLKSYQEAQQRYEQAIAICQETQRLNANSVYAHQNEGNARRGLAEVLVQLNQYDVAQQSYSKAIAAFDRAIELASDYVYAHHSKGRTLQSLAEWQQQLHPEKALLSYQRAIAAYDEALKRAPNFTYTHSSKGLTLQMLGDLYSELGLVNEAIARWQAAEAEFTRCLEIAPGDEDARKYQENLAESLKRLSENDGEGKRNHSGGAG